MPAENAFSFTLASLQDGPISFVQLFRGGFNNTNLLFCIGDHNESPYQHIFCIGFDIVTIICQFFQPIPLSSRIHSLKRIQGNQNVYKVLKN